MESHHNAVAAAAALFPEQVTARMHMADKERLNVDRVCGGVLVMPVGSGKTLVALSLIYGSPKYMANPTLIVCTLTLMREWCSAVKKFYPAKSSRVLVMHRTYSMGMTDWVKTEDLGKYDIVIAGYSGCSAAYSKILANQGNPRSRGMELLYLVEWERIVWDESQLLSNAETKRCKSARALRSDRRWCLTATPMVNSLSDLCVQMSVCGCAQVTGDISTDWRRRRPPPKTSCPSP